jgi:fatty acid desaturase
MSATGGREDTGPPYPRCPNADVLATTRSLPARAAAGQPAWRRTDQAKGAVMLWLIIGVVLLIIAIAGGTIVHPILFVLAILALLAFLVGRRGTAF